MSQASQTISLFTFIGTPNHEQDSLTALRVSHEKFHFDKVVCAVHELTDDIQSQLFSFCPEAEVHEVGLASAEDYNKYIVSSLNDVIDTEYVLTVQGDGFILDGEAWDDNFLNYDYIGSPWGPRLPQFGGLPLPVATRRVGNGGFSLRSKKFLEASAKLEYDPAWGTAKQTVEDAFLCWLSANELESSFDIKYAPVDVAIRFSVECTGVPEAEHIDKERPETYDTFGFHGNDHHHAALLKKYKNYLSGLNPSLKEVYPEYSASLGYGDKGTTHGYIEIYEQYITKDPCALLEIGVCRGHSIAMWKKLLPSSRIIGVDVNLSDVEFDLDGAELIEDNATLVDFADKIEDGSLDYIIDDGSHRLQDQKDSFKNLYQKLKSGGYYFVEDVANLDALDNFTDFLLSQELDSKYLVYECGKQEDDILVIITK